ncbi:UPF0547 protein C16orf87 homolog isoform X1 [Anabas testudineus]|uniref:UPF0547 protein C16orf87 homolog isoform X1 n=1 Tax=Anabas testudineus TaxID=64144 RepID=UPI000E45FAAB|nr:UPF0547 protein C16orf87 homolog isoform X1 [Anabas testudineus]
MSANKTKKVKMATKSCPECDQQIPVACKSCPCGYVFISRKLLNAKLNERSPAIADKLDFKRRRTERIRRERIDSPLTSDMENRRRSRTNSQSDPIRRGRGRPKSKNKKRRWIFMPVFLMRRPLYFLWPWLRSTARSLVRDSSYSLNTCKIYHKCTYYRKTDKWQCYAIREDTTG